MQYLTDILEGFHGKPYDASLYGRNMLGAEIQKFGESLLGQTCL